MVSFARHGSVLKITHDARDYAAGDVVAWNLRKGGSLPRLVTDRKNADGSRPLIMHNIGGGQVLQDILLAYEITGHYRYGLE